MSSIPIHARGTSSSGGSSYIQMRLLWAISILSVSALCLLAAPVPTNKPAAYPAWWFSRGAIAQLPPGTNSAPAWPTNYPVSDDYAVINEGQLKNFATQAYAELLAQSPTNVVSSPQWTNLASMVGSWSPTATNEDDYKAINLGQLKTVAKPFYDVLTTIGYSSYYPWTGANADDYSAANIGQTKNLFSFDVGYDPNGDGVPDWWEQKYLYQTGLASTNLAPNGSGLTLRQCYDQRVNPQETEASPQSEPLSISINATGPFQYPASPLIVTSITHPSNTTILSVAFYSGTTTSSGTLVGTVTSAPYDFVLSNLGPGNYNYTALVTAQNNTTLAFTTATATTQFQVAEANYYVRGFSSDPVFDSSVLAVDFEQGQVLDSTSLSGTNNFSSLYSPAQYPWFLRMQAETNELWSHILTVGVYGTFDVQPTISGTVVGGAPPLVAFGSQGGGTPLYTNQSYNFGVAAGGQLVFNPIIINSISSASPSVYTLSGTTGLAVGQPIVISGATVTGSISVNGTYLVGSLSGTTATLTTPTGTNVSGVTGYTANSGAINVSVPITVTSISSASPSVYTLASTTALHVGQMIVISGATVTGSISVNGTYLVSTISGTTATLSDPYGNLINGITGYTNGSAVINNADMKIEAYQASTFTSSGTLVNNVAPVYVQGFTLPRPGNNTTWTHFVNNGYVQDYPINVSYAGNTINLDTQVQYEAASGGVATSTWGQEVDYPLLVTHRATNPLFYYKVSYMGVTTTDNATSTSFGVNVPSAVSDSPMAIDSTGTNQIYNVDYTLDFTNPTSTAPTVTTLPQFQETPLPPSAQGMSVAELIANSPQVQGTLDAPGSSALNSLGLTNLGRVDDSPELRDHPALDQFVTSMNNDPMALANYVLNEINLTDAVGFNPNNITIASVSSSILTTTAPHNLQAGQTINITGATGSMASTLNGTFKVGTTGSTTLTLQTLTGTGVTLSGSYTADSGIINTSSLSISTISGTGVFTTTTSHGLTPGEMISISGAMSGSTPITALNSPLLFLVATTPTPTTFTLTQVGPPSGGTPLTTFSGGYNSGSGIINTSSQSINPQGVRRDALATYLEGQGSPTEQCALLVYMLRKAGYPCGYIFPNQDQMLMIDQQLSSILRMQIQGANGVLGYEQIPQLIPVNYPWVAAYIHGQWVHIFPWLKNTVVQEGPNLWNYLPTGYQTGGQWLLHYISNDPTIRQLTTPSGLYTDDVNVLFPLYVKQQLQGTTTSIDQLGMTYYNQQTYYTRWQDFPRPWQTPVVTDANLAQNLDYTQNPAALAPALFNIFDTINIQVFSDRNNSGTWDSGEPGINTGTLRLCDLHDRRLLLYDKVISGTDSTATYNMILSLEPFNAGNSTSASNGGPAYTFTGTATYLGGSSNPDPGPLTCQQIASVGLQTTGTMTTNDDALVYTITYNLHQQALSIPNVNSLNQWNFFLGSADTTILNDSRSLRKGDMACLSLDYGQVTQQMEEFQAEKYWNYQQSIAANPTGTADPELGEGQLLNLMGQCYYYKVSQLIQNTENWTKTNTTTWLAHGLSKLSPLRDSSNNPVVVPGNDILLCYPRVDMTFTKTAWVNNSTDNLNSGDTGNTAVDSAEELIIGGGSAYEHLIINQFFRQNAAISTVKLLDLAQGWSPGSTTGSPSLVNGNGVYTSGGTVTSPALTISAATYASPSVVTTSTPHGLSVGQTITISGAGGNTAINGTYVVASIPSNTSFTLRTTSTAGVATNPGLGGAGQPLILTASNYLTTGSGSYTYTPTGTLTGVTKSLSVWCGGSSNPATPAPAGSIWGNIQACFALTGANANSAPLTTVYITPGPVTATAQSVQSIVSQATPTQQYTGIGALCLGVGTYGAYISPNMAISLTGTVVDNGGFGQATSVAAPVISMPNPQLDAQILSPTPDGVFTVNVAPANTYTTSIGDINSTATYAPDISSPSDAGVIYANQLTGNVVLTTQQITASQDFANEFYAGSSIPTVTQFGSSAATVTLQALSNGDIGDPNFKGSMPTNSFSLSSAVYDPVNSITGEFYINALDLKLNGPMPLEIRRTYGSLNQANNNFGYGWRMSYFPYLMLTNQAVYNSSNTQLTTTGTLIYAAEMDGSVIVYRQQTSPTTRWIPQASDNPNMANVSGAAVGGMANPFNNRIDQSTTTISGTVYTSFTLTGADGSVRNFAVQSFPTTNGTTTVTRARPYLQKWTDNRGNYYNFSYGTSTNSPSYGQLTQISSSNGDFVGFDYDVNGHITQAFTGDGRFLYYQYDAFGDLTQVTLPDASTIQYDYQHVMSPSSTGTLVTGTGTYTGSGIITSDGNISISSVNSTGTLTTTGTNALAAGDVVVISGATGNTGINGTYTVHSVSGNSFTMYTGIASAAPDSTHLITQETKPNGRVLQNTYDSSRRVLSQSATVGTNETLQQNASFNYGSPTPNGDMTVTGSTVITDVFGNTTTYKYVESQITEIDYPAQNTSYTGQLSNGPTETQTWYLTTTGTGAYQRSLATHTDKRGLLKTYLYDSNGNLLSQVSKGNLTGGSSTTETSTMTMTYNSSGTVTLAGGGTAIPNTIASVTDQLGNGTTYSYGDTAHPYEPTSINRITASGTISTTTLQYGNVSMNGASASGLLQKETFAAGSSDQAVWQYTYNGNGFPTSKTGFTGTSDPNVLTTYTYDLRGEVTSETDVSGRSTTYTYDALGHRTGALRYDEWGNLVSWNFTYYNQNGDVQWIQGPRYSPNDYIYKQYDGAGRLSQEVKWLSAARSDGSGVVANGYATTNYQHDAFGNLTVETDPNLNLISMGYDAQGEMLNRTVSSPGGGSTLSTESFSYEPGGEVTSYVSTLGGTETKAYTYTGQLKSDALPDGTTQSYLYDLTGRVVQQTLTNGSYWTTTYNDLSRIVTRNFYNSSASLLMTESQTFDRRGNVVSKTDVAGNTFTSTYDGLNRVKTTTGPATSGTTAQQSTSYAYDAAGLKTTVTNAAGESTVTYLDALQRPTLVTVLNSGGSTASNTGFWYSPDHQSVVETQGSSTGTITTTTFTDTRGNPVLVRHSDNTWQGTSYDANGNKTLFLDEQGAATSWTYDALNRVLSQTLPAASSHAVTYFTYTLNSPGETILRQMPESLTAKTVYDGAGRKTAEELDGTGGAVTRNFSYAYYTSGATKGLLNTVSDPRGFTTTTTYDAWLRPSTVNSSGSSTAQQNQNTTYGYDNRGMVSSIAQAYATAATGPSTKVTRGYDGYGQLNAETIGVDPAGGTSYSTVSQWAQSWNSAGRRSALNWQVGSGAGSQYGYAYNASGLLTQVTDTGTYTYAYGDNNLLTSRTTPWLTQTISSRDGRGRITGESTTISGTTALNETMGWRNDDRLSSYSASGAMTLTGTTASTLNYTYDTRGEVVLEPYQLTSTDQETQGYIFDTTVTGDFSSFTNSGNNEAGLGVRTIKNRHATPHNISNNVANAQNALGQVTQENWSNTMTFDAVGNVTGRTPTAGSSTLTWDASNRLVAVATGTTTWTAVYDGLGRRVQSQNGTGATTVTYFYDPQVEFLELGHDNAGRTWNVYGPDKSGVYGGLGGLGGLEAVVTETGSVVNGETNNYFGDALAPPGSTTPWASIVGGYGVMQLSAPVDNILLEAQWRGKYLDPTGFYYMGARYYEPSSSRFLSADPLGHAASMSLYDYANGDPVNGFDPDGRVSSPYSSNVESGPTAGNGQNSISTAGQSSLYDYSGALAEHENMLQAEDSLQNTANSVIQLVNVATLVGAPEAEPELIGAEISAGLIPKVAATSEGTSINMGVNFFKSEASTAADAPLVQSEFGFVNNLPSKPAINWPPNNGFLGAPTPATLTPGTMIDRFGYNGGSFVSPQGIPYIQRSLAPGTQYTPYNVFQVMKPIDVNAGPIAPAFGMPGGGMQYKLPSSVQSLIDSGHLVPATGG
jgi:RHS repeat-associated protein